MTREELSQLCAAIKRIKAASDKLTRLKSWLEEQRDNARLQTTKAIYQAILDKIEEAT